MVTECVETVHYLAPVARAGGEPERNESRGEGRGRRHPLRSFKREERTSDEGKEAREEGKDGKSKEAVSPRARRESGGSAEPKCRTRGTRRYDKGENPKSGSSSKLVQTSSESARGESGKGRKGGRS